MVNGASDAWNTLAKTRAVTMYDQRGDGRTRFCPW